MRLLVLIAITTTASLAAADGVMMPGQACRPSKWGASGAGPTYTTGGARNDWTVAKTWYCLLRLPDAATATSRDLTWARAAVEDKHASVGFTCSVQARSASGAYYASASKTTGTSFTGIQALVWSDPVNGGAPIGAMGPLAIVCTVPKKGSLASLVIGVGAGE